MRVLFVCSGNAYSVISPIVVNQAESLRKEGLIVDIYPIIGKGLRGYLNNIPGLKKYLRNNKYDIIHAHYSLSGFVASLSGARPLIVSLMGSDTMSNSTFRNLIRVFYRFLWYDCLVKSQELKNKLRIEGIRILPNGVDLDRFKPIPRTDGLSITGWNDSRQHILFGANPERSEKNFPLLKEAFDKLNDIHLELHTLKEVPNEKMPYYFSAADVTILTSFWEGSPNVIKEAMACNCPVIYTDVGDVKWVTKGIEGCFLINFDSHDLVEKIKLALKFAKKNGRTDGRNRIIELGLDSISIARQLIRLYEEVMNNAK